MKNLGIALGAGVEQLDRMKRQDNEDARLKMVQEEFARKKKEWDDQDTANAVLADAVKPFEASDGYAYAGKRFDTQDAANQARQADADALAVVGSESGGVLAGPELATPEAKTKIVTPTRAQGLKRAANALAEKGLGLQSQAMEAQYNKAYQEELQEGLQHAGMTGDWNRALGTYNDKMKDGWTATIEHDDKGRVGIRVKNADGSKSGLLGGGYWQDHYEAATAMSQLSKNAPIDYLKLRSSDEAKAAQMDARQREFEQRQAQFEQRQELRQREFLARNELAALKALGGNGHGSSGSRSKGGGNDDGGGDGVLSFDDLIKTFGKSVPEDKLPEFNEIYQRLARNRLSHMGKRIGQAEVVSLAAQAVNGKAAVTTGFDPVSLTWQTNVIDSDGNKFNLRTLDRPELQKNAKGEPLMKPEEIHKIEANTAMSIAEKGLPSLSVNEDGTPKKVYSATELKSVLANKTQLKNLQAMASNNGGLFSQADVAEAQRILRAANLVDKHKAIEKTTQRDSEIITAKEKARDERNAAVQARLGYSMPQSEIDAINAKYGR